MSCDIGLAFSHHLCLLPRSRCQGRGWRAVLMTLRQWFPFNDPSAYHTKCLVDNSDLSMLWAGTVVRDRSFITLLYSLCRNLMALDANVLCVNHIPSLWCNFKWQLSSVLKCLCRWSYGVVWGGGAWRKAILVGTRTGGCTQALLEKSGIESSPDIFSLTKNRNVYNFCWCVWFENCVHLSNTRMFFDVLIIPSCFFIRVFTTVALKCGLSTHGLSYMNPGIVVMLQMSCNEHRSPQV